MTRSSRAGCELRRTLPATAQAVEKFFVEFRRHGAARLAGASFFAAELLTREALNNAVTHGCQGDPARYVRCMVRMKGRQLTIAVHDDGDGFDWREALGRPAAASADSGRGIEILLKYATRVRFNDSGNAVTIIKRF